MGGKRRPHHLMYQVSEPLLRALRTGYADRTYVEAWRGGSRVEWQSGPSPDARSRLPLTGGEVKVDGGTPGVRRTLNLTLAPEVGLWDALAPIGTEIRVFTQIRFGNGTTETIPQGIFDVDVQRLGYAANGDLSITAPDRWVRVQRARFLAPRKSTAGATAQAQISSLMLEVLPAGTSVADISTAAVSMPVQTWDRDRAEAIEGIAKAASLDVFIGRGGDVVIRDVPRLGSNPAWTVDASDSGVLLDADRERNRQRTYNVVVVNGTANDGVAPFPTVACWDNEPGSPTFAGPGSGAGLLTDMPPASLAGPFGQRPTFYSSPLLANSGQAAKAGATILDRVRGLAVQLTLSAAPNPALDDGDTIVVQLPRERWDKPRPVELHIIDSLTVPLVLRNAQRIETRSTRADDGQES